LATGHDIKAQVAALVDDRQNLIVVRAVVTSKTRSRYQMSLSPSELILASGCGGHLGRRLGPVNRKPARRRPRCTFRQPQWPSTRESGQQKREKPRSQRRDECSANEPSFGTASRLPVCLKKPAKQHLPDWRCRLSDTIILPERNLLTRRGYV
jgi:hypothetical protein